jgi:hypothetical protein
MGFVPGNSLEKLYIEQEEVLQSELIPGRDAEQVL